MCSQDKTTNDKIKTSIAATKTVVAAIKGITAAIVAGGWIVVVVILLLCAVGMAVGQAVNGMDITENNLLLVLFGEI